MLGLLDGALAPTAGRVRHGRTVALQHLTQDLDDLDPEGRVLPTLESIRRVTAHRRPARSPRRSMLERFGFTGDRLTARIGDLSGGERRRFQLLRLLLTEPNVLLLDEPTNDLDIDTLNVLEDFLDGWPGTLVVVSHDRYFLERVTDSVWALLGDGQISMLPGGVDEYLRRRAADLAAAADAEAAACRPGRGRATVDVAKARAGSAEERAARKTLARLDKQLERVAEQEAALNAAIARRRPGLRAARRAHRRAPRGRRRSATSSSRSGSRPPRTWSDLSRRERRLLAPDLHQSGGLPTNVRGSAAIAQSSSTTAVDLLGSSAMPCADAPSSGCCRA